MAGKDSSAKDLQRSLGLRHVFVLSTGGTISAGLFFLPSFAVDKAGPSAVLAYLVAGLLALPAMLSVSELSTAMPRAGGLYYFLARALGPAGGTMSGVSTWVSKFRSSSMTKVGVSSLSTSLMTDFNSK